MIWLVAAVLLVCALTPAGIVLRRRVQVRGRRDASLALYRAQVVELDRDLGDGRISATDHATALLEVQRRLLAAAETPDIPVMADQLRAVLAQTDPHSERAREGELMLGNLEASRGNFAEAAAVWRKALTVKFDPLLEAEVADASTRAEGQVSPASAALFRDALANAPADAPWRSEVEQRLAEAPSH